MSAVSCLALWAMLTAPPSDPLPVVDPADWPGLQAALHSLAIELELLDRREDRLVRYEEFHPDLVVLRRRYAQLKNAPSLADAARFPHRAIVVDLLAFNRTYRRHLEMHREMDRDRSGPIREAIREADHLHRVWDAVREARCEIYYVPVRRAALQALRELIGESAYNLAQMPPHVPLWRFIDLR